MAKAPAKVGILGAQLFGELLPKASVFFFELKEVGKLITRNCC